MSPGPRPAASRGPTWATATPFSINTTLRAAWSGGGRLGTSGYDYGTSVAVDKSGDAYVCGYTSGSMAGGNAGLYDVFLTKFDPSGNTLWTQQIGTSQYDYGMSVAVDSSGHAILCGYTYGAFPGFVNAGNYDAFMAKFDSSGNMTWLQQIGSPADDEFHSAAVGPSGLVYFAGYTYGSLAGPNLGNYDAVLYEYTPEPATLSLLVLGGLAVFRRRK